MSSGLRTTNDRIVRTPEIGPGVPDRWRATPKQGSWLNLAESELNAQRHQRIPWARRDC